MQAEEATKKPRIPWRPISEAPKDRTVIWAKLRDDIAEDKEESAWKRDLMRWRGLEVPLKHPGDYDEGYDHGWNVAAPVGQGGIPDEWIAGWIPLNEE